MGPPRAGEGGGATAADAQQMLRSPTRQPQPGVGRRKVPAWEPPRLWPSRPAPRAAGTEVPGESSFRSRVPTRGLCRDRLLRVLRSSFHAAERASYRTPCKVEASCWRPGNLWGNPRQREGTPERGTWACLQGGHGVLMKAPSFQVEAGKKS